MCERKNTEKKEKERKEKEKDLASIHISILLNPFSKNIMGNLHTYHMNQGSLCRVEYKNRIFFPPTQEITKISHHNQILSLHFTSHHLMMIIIIHDDLFSIVEVSFLGLQIQVRSSQVRLGKIIQPVAHRGKTQDSFLIEKSSSSSSSPAATKENKNQHKHPRRNPRANRTSYRSINQSISQSGRHHRDVLARDLNLSLLLSSDLVFLLGLGVVLLLGLSVNLILLLLLAGLGLGFGLLLSGGLARGGCLLGLLDGRAGDGILSALLAGFSSGLGFLLGGALASLLGLFAGATLDLGFVVGGRVLLGALLRRLLLGGGGCGTVRCVGCERYTARLTGDDGGARSGVTVLGAGAHGCELLLEDTPGVLRSLDGVESTTGHELLNVNLWSARLEAEHGDGEENVVSLGEGGLFGGLLDGSGGGGRGGRHIVGGT